MVGITKEAFIKEYAESLKNEKASLFIGSGISRQAGYATWKRTLKECADEIDLDVEKERDLITLAEFYVQTKQRTKINQTIASYFKDKNGNPTNVHRILATLPIKSIWTTNYDTLIERYLSEADITYSVVTDDRSYISLDPTAKVKVHKIHGDVNTPDRCVITRRDYEKFEEEHDIVLSELKGEMCTNSFLFLGYSFSDIDIQHILSKIRLIYDEDHPQRHYCVIEKVKMETCVDEEEYTYKLNRQAHYIRDMESYGLNVVLVDSYSEIEGILKEISIRVHLRDILISGAYEDSSPLAVNRITPLANKLSQKLIESGYKIVTGYGKNLGADVVAGAFQGCENNHENPKNFNEYVLLFPFSYKVTKSAHCKEIYTAFRKNMISKTGISIFICGQTISTNGNLVNSTGVLEEYRISKEAGNLIIPIPTTGGAAMQIWNLEKNDNTFSSQFEEFQNLSTESNPDKIVELIMNMIAKYIKQYQ